ncbi:MAG: pyridoxal phosphate-dependent aminotransferase [Candidatus Thermoplasmatota archaeon]|nr:pyridoxal phosphate-dependent aminotransferase [Candidatus Thermoplasmatota archaeon]
MDFDEGLDRTGTECAKWDFVEEYFDRDDVLPMWVADSDWKTSDAIIEALKDRVEHGVFGYGKPGKEHDEAIVDWVARRYDWEIKPEWIVYTNGITPSLSVSVRTFTNLGDGIVIQPPVYFPFFSVIENGGARVIKNELRYDSGENTYGINFEDLEEKFEACEPTMGRGDRSRMMILCNPHNPVGRVWSEEELERIGELALENDIMIISDEIFSDYVYEGEHTPFSSLSDEIAQNSITMFAPTKTFNIAGLNIGIAVIPNSRLRRRFENSRERLVKKGNVFGLVALKAAYNKGEKWLEAQLDYLKKNKEYAVNFVKDEIPKVEVVDPEGTFLLWMDFKELELEPEELDELMLDEAKVALNNGAWFGESGKGFMRLNFACPRSTLKEGLERIKSAIMKLDRY